MADPIVTPFILSSLVSATSGFFNGFKSREQNTELARHNQLYQQRQQEMQLIQMKLNYLHQGDSLALQAEQARLNREQQTALELFRQQVQREMNEQSLQFQTWRLEQEQTLQKELAAYGRETQLMVAAYQRETTRQQPEVNKLYETWPLRIVPLQILNDQPSSGNPPLKVIIAPPEVDFDKFGTGNTGVPKLEKGLAEGLRQFLGKYYPLNHAEYPVEFLGGAWDAKRFHGEASIKALFSMLQSESLLVLESEIDGDYLNLRFAYWSAGQARYTYEPVISKFRYRDLVYASAKERARKWKTAHDLLVQQGKNPSVYNELDTYNLKVLEEDEQLAQFMDISQLQPRYKLRADDFEALNQFLTQQHCLIAGLIADVHHLLCHNTKPQIAHWLQEATTNDTHEYTLQLILETYQQILTKLVNEQAFWAANIALDIAFSLTKLSDKTWAYLQLNNSLAYWLQGRKLLTSNDLDTNLNTLQYNLLTSEASYIKKLQTVLNSLNASEKANKLYACYQQQLQHQEESKIKLKLEAERKAREEAQRKAETERRAREEEARRKAEIERKAREEVEARRKRAENLFMENLTTMAWTERNECLEWYKAAVEGQAWAQTQLGWMYHTGFRVTLDYSEAVKWFRQAAEQGDANAQFNLGVIYKNGQGVTQNYSEAIKWYRQAAEQGYAAAQYNLGLIYDNGQGVTQNYSEAIKWYRQAAEQNYALALNNLGVLYENGQGVTQFKSIAIRYYEQAAEQGLEIAINNLKRLRGY